MPTHYDVQDNNNFLQIEIKGSGKWFQPLTQPQMENLVSEEPIYSLKEQQIITFSVSALVKQNVFFDMRFPFAISKENTESLSRHDHTPVVVEYGKISGLTDAWFTLRVQRRLGANQDGLLSVAGGVRAPTGQRNLFGSKGLLPPLHLQPSSGSWDPVAQVSWWKNYHRFDWGVFTSGRLATKAFGHRMGSSVTADAVGGWFPFPLSNNKTALRLHGGIQAHWFDRMYKPAQHHNNTVVSRTLVPFTHSGGYQFLTNMGITFFVPSGIRIPLEVHIPIYQHNHGLQPKLTWSGSLGLSYHITQNSNQIQTHK